jgi:triphosphoribosyl-dephospho-CoA synthase
MDSRSLSIGQCATLACLLEVAIPKPGNVHRGADFEDLTLIDLLASATAIGPAMDAAGQQPLGKTVLDAITATQALVNTNANLGIVLLIAPLAKVPRGEPLRDGLRATLAYLDEEDAANVYRAIALANPGGLGAVESMDVQGPPPGNLLTAMQAAAERDIVARQYATGFGDLFESVIPWLVEDCGANDLSTAVIHTHLRLMAYFPDSLIQRKCGQRVAQESADRAAAVLECGQPSDETYHRALADLDFWLRSDGHRRNPGSTADLIAAGLFALLRDGQLRGRDGA